MEPITLTTERLLLRPLETSDVDAVHAACQDPDIPRWTTVPSPYTREHAVDFAERISPRGWRDDTLYNFGVFTREDAAESAGKGAGKGAREGGVLVGSMGLVRLGQLYTADRQAELGYWTVKEQRGKGYTAEAGRAVCAWAFEALGVERLEWFAEAGNEGSRAVALRIGFVMEGTVRAKIAHLGSRRDAWSGALLPSDLSRRSHTPYTPYAGA